jgi:hypothetical protein
VATMAQNVAATSGASFNSGSGEDRRDGRSHILTEHNSLPVPRIVNRMLTLLGESGWHQPLENAQP